MASSSSLSLSFPSSSLSPNWEHDVFPSFHGPDVRTTFLSHTLKEFRIKGIDTFIDNGIKRGESIGPELKRAIRGSKIAIVLLSEKYASSSWCLDELVEIIKCKEAIHDLVSMKAVHNYNYRTKKLSQMLNHKDMVITHLGVAQRRLKGKKVFLVLDDVDWLAQLMALAGESQWFGLGSRIVVTTQDQRVLKAHGINDLYKVDYPTANEALQMFCKYAFGQEYPKDGFTELAWEVTKLVGKLPLGLQVMGSHFSGMSKDVWIKTLPRLRSCLDREI